MGKRVRSSANPERMDDENESTRAICPKCDSNEQVIPIVYGRPNKALRDIANQGKVKLGGCMMDQKKNFCKSCEESF